MKFESVMLDRVASQYMHFCVVLLCEVYCVIVLGIIWARDHYCVLFDVTRNLLVFFIASKLISS